MIILLGSGITMQWSQELVSGSSEVIYLAMFTSSRPVSDRQRMRLPPQRNNLGWVRVLRAFS
jgi:hypothetical protein